MLHIVLVTPRPEGLRLFTEALTAEPDVHPEQVGSGAEALSRVRTASPHLVILDSELPDAKPLSLVSDLLKVNAMVNTAVMSSLTEEEFHEASEGLGILTHLPVNPGKDDVAKLMHKLRSVLGLLV